MSPSAIPVCSWALSPRWSEWSSWRLVWPRVGNRPSGPGKSMGRWSALSGSILLWGLILGGYATAMVWRFRKRATEPLVAWATLVVYVVTAFFFGLMLHAADPFQHVVGAIPVDGAGPNSLLQDNPLQAIHPPMLYLGFVGFTLPFAFAIASL